MTRINITTARNDFCELVRRAETGEQVTITRKGRAVARLVGVVGASHDANRVAKAFSRLARLRQGKQLPGNLKPAARMGLH